MFKLFLKSSFVALCVYACSVNSTFAAKKSALETSGDILQFVNPIVAASISSQEKGVGHFGVIYAEVIGITAITKVIGPKAKWQIAKRPAGGSRKSKAQFNGFPSGHTASAWTAASYVRTFSDDYKMASIPLYISAAVTGYSRVKAKKHTTLQVLTGAALSEAANMINAKLEWSNNYRATAINIGPDGASASFKINF